MSLIQDHLTAEPAPPIDPEAPLLGEIGHLQTRLARSQSEILSAQSVRYQVFYGEMGGQPSDEIRLAQRDQDNFDPHCDHLLVLDTGGQVGTGSANVEIVGTYRMMRHEQARQAGGFYSQSEYDLTPLIVANPTCKFLELGRSCILPDYRNKRTMELLWHGTWSHAVTHGIDIMFGCASFEGTDPTRYTESLSWLAQNVVLDDHEDCPAVAANSINLRQLTNAPDRQVTARQAMANLPPLIKGYLRLGAQIASHAVVDEQFGTIDVLVVLKVARINPRYLSHYGADASRFAT